MGHIKEPRGIDFVINSRALTSDEEKALSSYIREYKAKHPAKSVRSKRAGKATNKKKKVLS